MAGTKRKRKKSLAHGRPTVAKKPATTQSSKATRTVINAHHQLQKQLAKARRVNDAVEAKRLEKELEKNGGIEQYQSASITGQSITRGGDSSTVLVEWLKPKLETMQDSSQQLRVLEVGSLAIDNAISRVPNIVMTRIDLKSQHPQIREQDFMTMRIPLKESEAYDIVSLSLVVNYVPDAEGRGDMLKRVGSFLRSQALPELKSSESVSTPRKLDMMPALFLVLPAPCVTNSRYLNEEHLGTIMSRLGYVRVERKLSAKLVYYLWRFDGLASRATSIPKRKVNDGKDRNNFCIVLR